MGFLDNVKDALKVALSKAKADDVVVDKADTTTADDSTIPTPEPIVEPTDTAVEEPAREVKLESYTVKSGDTLSEIGARFGVSTQEIAKLNGIENPDLIFPGQVFRIPQG